MIDVNGDNVQIEISDDGKKIWVNVDGVCKFRSYDTASLRLTDNRHHRIKVNPDFIDEDVMEDILSKLGLEVGVVRKKYIEKLRQMSVYEAFDAWLSWNGIQGWTQQILEAWETCLSSSTMGFSVETSKSDQGSPPSTTETVN